MSSRSPAYRVILPTPVRLLLAGLTLAVVMGATMSPLPAAGAVPSDRRRVDGRTGMLEVPFEELTAAIRRKDRAEMGRLVEQVGPARLAEALRRPDSATVLAALAGISVLPGNVRLIGPVTELVVTAEPGPAAVAAHTLGEILAPVTTAELEEWEVPPDIVDAACVVLRGAATAAENPTPVRLAALDALGDASALCVPTPELIELLRDPAPAVRRAAALVLRPQQRLATGGFASGTRDIDKGVATASVAALCEVMGLPGGGVSRNGGSAAREPIWEQTRQAARRLVVASETPPEDAVQMLDCLDPTSASDRRILDGLRARHRTPLADRAAEILSVSQAAQGRPRP